MVFQKESQFIFGVDCLDQPLRLVEKPETHLNGVLRRFFSIFIFRYFDSSLPLLLLQRAFGKYHSEGLWTNTCCSYDDNASLEQAPGDRLRTEMGFSCELHPERSFHCLLGYITHKLFNPNPQEVQDYQLKNVELLLSLSLAQRKDFTVWFFQAFELALKFIKLLGGEIKKMSKWQIPITIIALCINFSDAYASTDRQEASVEVFLGNSLKCEFNIGQQLTSFSNNNFIIQEPLTGGRWVLRLPHEVSNLLSDRVQERKVLEWALKEGISLIEIKDYDSDKGYLLTRFLRGQSCSAADFKDTTKLQNALKLLYHVHTSKTAPISAKFQPLSRFFATSSVASSRGLSLPKEVQDVADQLEQLLSQIPTCRFQSLACHNDPSPENFFYQDGHLYLHDWELAGFNDPMWDLTHFSVIAQIDPEKILSFYPVSDPLALEKMLFFRPFIFFNTVVWTSLERQQQFSSLSPQITEMLYHTFLEKIAESIKSSSFQVSFQKLIQGGDL